MLNNQMVVFLWNIDNNDNGNNSDNKSGNNKISLRVDIKDTSSDHYK